MFTGTYTAMVTPFRNGQLDEPALEGLIKLQIKGGVDGIVPVGTTGESPTVDCTEHIRIIELAVKFAGKKIKVLAGTGANATSEAIALTQAAEKVGADGSLQVAPYYNKPTQEGLYQHFRAIAHATKLPLVLYNIPASFHGGGGGLSFADGHSETHGWRDSRTRPPIQRVSYATSGQSMRASPGNADVEWLQERTSELKKNTTRIY